MLSAIRQLLNPPRPGPSDSPPISTRRCDHWRTQVTVGVNASRSDTAHRLTGLRQLLCAVDTFRSALKVKPRPCATLRAWHITLNMTRRFSALRPSCLISCIAIRNGRSQSYCPAIRTSRLDPAALVKPVGGEWDCADLKARLKCQECGRVGPADQTGTQVATAPEA